MFLQLLLMLLSLPFCTPADTRTPNHPLGDGEVLVSGGIFALGFFSAREHPNHRYVGVWYLNISPQTVVWVLNRDDPINDTFGVLSIRVGGDLVLHCRNSPIWSTSVSALSEDSTVAQLLETSNLVLMEKESKKVALQGFDYPTDTMLPHMKFGVDRKTGLNRFLTSWKSPGDPGKGEYSYKMEISGSPQPFLRKGVEPIWRNGPWIGLGRAGVPEMDNGFVFNVSVLNNEDEVSEVLYGIVKPSLLSILKLDSDGVIRHYGWHE